MKDHCHEVSHCDCDSCLCRGCWAGGQFCRLAAPRKAVHADGHPTGGPISAVRGSIFATVRWLTADATQKALAAFARIGRFWRAKRTCEMTLVPILPVLSSAPPRV